MNWTNEFRDRINDFENQFKREDSFAISLKIRVSSGCFHRDCSPNAYRIIDNEIQHLDLKKEGIALIEHESGPEILIMVAAIFELTASVLTIIAFILDARKKGIENGDRPKDDLNIVVRNFNKDGKVKDETVLKINHIDKIDKMLIKTLVEKSIMKAIKERNKLK